jgi:hypothetical protein
VKKSARKGDSAQRAFQVVQQATGDFEPTPATDPRVIEGAKKGGATRASKLSAKKRTEIAKKAAAARWGKSAT